MVIVKVKASIGEFMSIKEIFEEVSYKIKKFKKRFITIHYQNSDLTLNQKLIKNKHQ